MRLHQISWLAVASLLIICLSGIQSIKPQRSGQKSAPKIVPKEEMPPPASPTPPLASQSHSHRVPAPALAVGGKRITPNNRQSIKLLKDANGHRPWEAKKRRKIDPNVGTATASIPNLFSPNVAGSVKTDHLGNATAAKATPAAETSGKQTNSANADLSKNTGHTNVPANHQQRNPAKPTGTEKPTGADENHQQKQGAKKEPQLVQVAEASKPQSGAESSKAKHGDNNGIPSAQNMQISRLPKEIRTPLVFKEVVSHPLKKNAPSHIAMPSHNAMTHHQQQQHGGNGVAGAPQVVADNQIVLYTNTKRRSRGRKPHVPMSTFSVDQKVLNNFKNPLKDNASQGAVRLPIVQNHQQGKGVAQSAQSSGANKAVELGKKSDQKIHDQNQNIHDHNQKKHDQRIHDQKIHDQNQKIHDQKIDDQNQKIDDQNQKIHDQKIHDQAVPMPMDPVPVHGNEIVPYDDKLKHLVISPANANSKQQPRTTPKIDILTPDRLGGGNVKATGIPPLPLVLDQQGMGNRSALTVPEEKENAAKVDGIEQHAHQQHEPQQSHGQQGGDNDEQDLENHQQKYSQTGEEKHQQFGEEKHQQFGEEKHQKIDEEKHQKIDEENPQQIEEEKHRLIGVDTASDQQSPTDDPFAQIDEAKPRHFVRSVSASPKLPTEEEDVHHLHEHRHHSMDYRYQLLLLQQQEQQQQQQQQEQQQQQQHSAQEEEENDEEDEDEASQPPQPEPGTHEWQNAQEWRNDMKKPWDDEELPEMDQQNVQVLSELEASMAEGKEREVLPNLDDPLGHSLPPASVEPEGQQPSNGGHQQVDSEVDRLGTSADADVNSISLTKTLEPVETVVLLSSAEKVEKAMPEVEGDQPQSANQNDPAFEVPAGEMGHESESSLPKMIKADNAASESGTALADLHLPEAVLEERKMPMPMPMPVEVEGHEIVPYDYNHKQIVDFESQAQQPLMHKIVDPDLLKSPGDLLPKFAGSLPTIAAQPKSAQNSSRLALMPKEASAVDNALKQEAEEEVSPARAKSCAASAKPKLLCTLDNAELQANRHIFISSANKELLVETGKKCTHIGVEIGGLEKRKGKLQLKMEKEDLEAIKRLKAEIGGKPILATIRFAKASANELEVQLKDGGFKAASLMFRGSKKPSQRQKRVEKPNRLHLIEAICEKAGPETFDGFLLDFTGLKTFSEHFANFLRDFLLELHSEASGPKKRRLFAIKLDNTANQMLSQDFINNLKNADIVVIKESVTTEVAKEKSMLEALQLQVQPLVDCKKVAIGGLPAVDERAKSCQSMADEKSRRRRKRVVKIEDLTPLELASLEYGAVEIPLILANANVGDKNSNNCQGPNPDILLAHAQLFEHQMPHLGHEN